MKNKFLSLIFGAFLVFSVSNVTAKSWTEEVRDDWTIQEISEVAEFLFETMANEYQKHDLDELMVFTYDKTDFSLGFAIINGGITMLIKGDELKCPKKSVLADYFIKSEKCMFMHIIPMSNDVIGVSQKQIIGPITMYLAHPDIVNTN